MIILSIDPGTISTGWAFVNDKKEIIASGTLKANRDTAPLQRAIAITNGILTVIDKAQTNFKVVPDYAVIEDQYVKSNARSSLILSKLVGMLVYAIYQEYDIAIYTIAPTQIYNILPFNSRQFKSRTKYHKAVVEYVYNTYKIDLTSTDEAFAILLGLSYVELLLSEGVDDYAAKLSEHEEA